MSARKRQALASVLALGVGCAAIAGCSTHDTAAGDRFTPKTAHVLTVATESLPAAGFYVAQPDGEWRGYEADLAHDLASAFGLDSVRFIEVPFPDIVAGRLGDADLALSRVTPTSEREKTVDFSTPYLKAPPGVLVRAGIEAADTEALKELRWVVRRPSTLTDRVEQSIRPDQTPIEAASLDAVVESLRRGTADAALLDLPVAVAIARADPDRLAVAGQLSRSEGLAVLLPNKSRNLDAVDSAIRSLRAKGRLDELAATWLPGSEDVPLIRTSD